MAARAQPALSRASCRRVIRRAWRLPLVLVLLVPMLVAGAGSGLLLLLDRLLPPPWDATLEYSTRVLDRDGETLRLYTTAEGYWRLPVDLEQIDPRFIERLIAFEDRRFFSHSGVDPFALLRAGIQALRHGRVVSGASTLTMQTVRLLEPRPRRLSSKGIEMFRAWQLERRMDKATILEWYLTLAPYGGNLQGLVAASEFYFGKRPVFLTLDESALLIALPQAPEARRPDRHPEAARAARDRILERWLRTGGIDALEFATARATPVVTARQPAPLLAPHLSDRLRSLRNPLGELRTSLDADLQRRVERLLNDRQRKLARGQTSAVLVVEHGTGLARVWAGSGDYFATDFPGQVDMVAAIRSPGSLLKPFIYGLAFDRGLAHPNTLVIDAPDSSRAYWPRNFDQAYRGEMTVGEALRQSRNVPAVRLLERVQVEALTDLFTTAGVDARIPGRGRPGLAIGLGGVGMGMLDLAAMYGAIGQAGVSHRPRAVPGEDRSPGTALLTEESAWYLARILVDTPRPTGRWPDARPVAIKTGTSFGYRDAWAVGVDASHTVVVWVGRPDGGYTAGLTGQTAAVPLLLDLFEPLPLSRADWPGSPPASALIVRSDALPESLRTLAPPTQAPMTGTPGPRFVFPAERAELAWNRSDPTVLLDVRGGQQPLHWLIDGQPIDLETQGRHYQWLPDAPGTYRVTAIDARGRSTSRHFVLQPLVSSSAQGLSRIPETALAGTAQP